MSFKLTENNTTMIKTKNNFIYFSDLHKEFSLMHECLRAYVSFMKRFIWIPQIIKIKKNSEIVRKQKGKYLCFLVLMTSREGQMKLADLMITHLHNYSEMS